MLQYCTHVTSTRPNVAHYTIYFFSLPHKGIYSRHDVTLALGTKFENIIPGNKYSYGQKLSVCTYQWLNNVNNDICKSIFTWKLTRKEKWNRNTVHFFFYLLFTLFISAFTSSTSPSFILALSTKLLYVHLLINYYPRLHSLTSPPLSVPSQAHQPRQRALSFLLHWNPLIHFKYIRIFTRKR